jgi:hypothetical protein
MRVTSEARSIGSLPPASHCGIPVLIVSPSMLGLCEKRGISLYIVSYINT